MTLIQGDAAVEYALLDTPIGRCGMAWSTSGIRCFQLPESRDALTRERIIRRFPQARPSALPASVSLWARRIKALLGGERDDLRDIPLDFTLVPAFHCRVYDAARSILPGTTSTYGELARVLGDPGAARAVGQALGQNPYAVIVPCHRVLAARRGTGGFSAHGGVRTKRLLLEIEGVLIPEQLALRFSDS